MTSVVHAEYKKLAPYAECRYAEYHFAECRGVIFYAGTHIF